MPHSFTLQEIILRLGVASLCGLLLGLDCEIKQKTVGVGAFLLVCLGSASFTMMIVEITNYYQQIYEDLSMDPTRIIQGVVTGIGFLGGGAILQKGDHVAGTATGASIWVCGAIGVACGYGLYVHAGITTAFAFAVLTIVGLIRSLLREDLELNEEPCEDTQNTK